MSYFSSFIFTCFHVFSRCSVAMFASLCFFSNTSNTLNFFRLRSIPSCLTFWLFHSSSILSLVSKAYQSFHLSPWFLVLVIINFCRSCSWLSTWYLSFDWIETFSFLYQKRNESSLTWLFWFKKLILQH